MNYKKISGLLAFAVFFGGSTAFAAKLSIDSINPVQNTVTVSGTLSGEENRDILLYVAKDVENPTKEDVSYVAQAVTDEKGKFTVTFEMNDAANDGMGKFFVYANSEAADGAVRKSFSFIGEAQRNAFIDAMNSAATAGEMASVINNNKEVCNSLGLSDEADVSEELFESRPENGYSDETIVNIYNRFVLLKVVNQASDSDVILEAFEKFAGYIVNRNKEAEVFISELLYDSKPYSDLEKLNKEYDLSNVLNSINNAGRDDFAGLLEDNKELLGIEDNDVYRDFLDLSNSKKVTVVKNSVKELAENAAKSVDDIMDIIEDAIDDLGKSTTSSSGSSGGGGGRGGGYAITTPSAGQNMTGTKTENKEPEITVSEATVKVFKDVSEGFWGAEAIKALAEKDILTGDGGYFRPDDNITREEFVTVAVKAFKIYNGDAVCNFDDVADNSWYYSYVASGFENGIINGVSEASFGTGLNITRQDVAVILARLLGENDKGEPDFNDNSEISDYAKSGVALMQNKGIIQGRGNGEFAPKNNCTRAEAAAMIYKILKMQGGIV